MKYIINMKIPDFDGKYYLEIYPDLITKNITTEKDALDHYLEYGKLENRLINSEMKECNENVMKKINNNILENDDPSNCKIKISIVMTSLNRKTQILFTLKSFLQYVKKYNLEIIIVDDGSDVSIEDIKQRFFRMNITIISISKKDKKGINGINAYNIGFKHATGDIIIIQNSEVLHVGDILHNVLKYISNDNYLVFSVFNSPNYEYNDTFYSTIINNKNANIYNEFIEKIDYTRFDFDFDFYTKKYDDCKNMNYEEAIKHWYEIGKNEFRQCNAEDVWYEKKVIKKWKGWLSHPEYNPRCFHFLTAVKRENLFKIGGFDENLINTPIGDDDDFIVRMSNVVNEIHIIDPIICCGIHQYHADLSQKYKRLFEYKKYIRHSKDLIRHGIKSNEKAWNHFFHMGYKESDRENPFSDEETLNKCIKFIQIRNGEYEFDKKRRAMSNKNSGCPSAIIPNTNDSDDSINRCKGENPSLLLSSDYLIAENKNDITKIDANADKKNNIGIFTPWCDQGLGIQSRIYKHIFESIGYNVYIFASYPYISTKGTNQLIRSTNEWSSENVYKSNNTRTQIIEKEIDLFVKKYKINHMIIPEIQYESVFLMARHLKKKYNIPTYGIPNVECIDKNELPYFDIFKIIFTNNKMTYDILQKYNVKNVVLLGFHYCVPPAISVKPINLNKQIKKNEKIQILHLTGLNGLIRKRTMEIINIFKDIYDDGIKYFTLNINIQGNFSEELIKDLNYPFINLTYKHLSYGEILNLYNENHISLQFSKHEGLGLGFYESCFMGTPVITLDAPPHNEVIVEQKNGWIVPCYMKKDKNDIYEPIVEQIYFDNDVVKKKIKTILLNIDNVNNVIRSTKPYTENIHSLTSFVNNFQNAISKKNASHLIDKCNKTPSSKKIFLFSESSYPGGGGEEFIFDIATYFSEKNYIVYWASFHNWKRDFFIKKEIIDNEHYKEVRLPFNFTDKDIFESLKNIVSEINPNYIFSQGMGHKLICDIGKSLNIPTITIWCFWEEAIDINWKYGLIDINNNLNKHNKSEHFTYIVDNIDHFYFASKFVMNTIERKYNVKFNDDNVFPTLSKNNRFLKNCNIDSYNSPYIALLDAHSLKGGEIIAQLIKLNPNLSFLAIKTECEEHGPISIKKAMDEVNNSTNILYYERVNNVSQIYDKTKILLCPTYLDETFCRVVFESFQNKIPVIFSNKGNLNSINNPHLLKLNLDVISLWNDTIHKLLNDKEYYDFIVNEQYRYYLELKNLSDIKIIEDKFIEIEKNKKR